MPKFFHNRDIDFIKTISEEVVDYVVEQWITLFKMSVGETKTNLYGESLGKVYHAPATLMCIVDREPQSIIHEGFGPGQEQAVTFAFNIQRLRTHEIPQIRTIHDQKVPADAIQNTAQGYPEIGDIIIFDNTYYEIGQVQKEKLIGGSPLVFPTGSADSDDNRMSLVVTAHMVRKTAIQIEDRIY